MSIFFDIYYYYYLNMRTNNEMQKRKTLEQLCEELYGEGIANEEKALAAAVPIEPSAVLPPAPGEKL